MEKTYTLEGIEALARDLLAVYGVPHQSHATVWALKGDLGAGKTTLVQALARVLGVSEGVTSPTFILEKVYDLESKPFEHLVHIDVYRFDTPEEVKVLGWEELVASPHNLIVLEWPERIGAYLPEHAHMFELTSVDERTRRIRHG